jgi:hypothetical protein
MKKSGISISFDTKKLDELQKRLKKLDGQKNVPLTQLLTDSFLHAHTNFKTLQEMIDASGIKDPEDIGKEQFSKFVSTHTSFSSWQAMIDKATQEYVTRKLGL